MSLVTSDKRCTIEKDLTFQRMSVLSPNSDKKLMDLEILVFELRDMSIVDDCS
jgi:hypothetical protein